MFNRVKLTKNHFIIETNNLSADLKGNFRDAMVSVTINKIPDDADEAIEAIKEFIGYLTNKVGGKMLLRLSPDVKDKILSHPRVNEVFDKKQCNAPIKYISKEKLSGYLTHFLNKDKIQTILNNPDFQLLADEKDYENKYEALYNFKKNNSNFNVDILGMKTPISKSLVTDAKIAAGLYSTEAEKEKIKNEFVKHFSIYNPKTKEYIATFQVFIDDDLAYVSDVIVNQNLRRQGCAQSIAIQAFQALQKSNPQIKGVWLIGGGEGISLLGDFLKENTLSLEVMSPSVQKELGVIPIFTSPKELLLKAGLKAIPTSSNYVKNSIWIGAAIAAMGATAYVANNYISKKIL